MRLLFLAARNAFSSGLLAYPQLIEKEISILWTLVKVVPLQWLAFQDFRKYSCVLF